MLSSSVVPCHSAPLWSVHNPSASSGHDLSKSFGVHLHSSPLQWETVFVLRVVLHFSQLLCLLSHSRTLPCASRQRQSKNSLLPLLVLLTQKRHPTSGQILLTSFSLIVHPAVLSFSGLASCLLHSESLPCPRTRGLMPSTRIVSPHFVRPRFQLGLLHGSPLSEIDQHGPTLVCIHRHLLNILSLLERRVLLIEDVCHG